MCHFIGFWDLFHLFSSLRHKCFFMNSSVIKRWQQTFRNMQKKMYSILHEMRQSYDNANRPKPKIALFWRLHEFGKVCQKIIESWTAGMNRWFLLTNFSICTTDRFDIKVKNVFCISVIRTVFSLLGRIMLCFTIFFCHLRLCYCLLYHQDQISVLNLYVSMTE